MSITIPHFNNIDLAFNCRVTLLEKANFFLPTCRISPAEMSQKYMVTLYGDRLYSLYVSIMKIIISIMHKGDSS